MSILDDIRAELLPIVSRVNAQDERYPAMCMAVTLLLSAIKVSLEDKQQMLADVSDILDNLAPSSRSGLHNITFTKKPPKSLK